MAPSRCLPDPEVLDRLLSNAGLRAARPSSEAAHEEGDLVRFDGTSAAPSLAPSPPAKIPSAKAPPAHAPPAHAPPAAASAFARGPHPPGGPRAPSVPSIAVQEVRAPAPRDLRPRVPVADPAMERVERLHPAVTGEPPRSEMSDERLLDEVLGPDARAQGVEVRLQRLISWLMSSTRASSAFVADPEGLPLLNLNTPEPYVVAIGPLARAQAEIARFVPDSPPGTSVVELDRQSMLEVVWVDTAMGRLGVGLVLAESLPHSQIDRIRRVTALSIASRGDT